MSAAARVARGLRSLRDSDLAGLGAQIVRDISADGVPQMSAALAYYAALSLAPLLVVTLGIVGLMADRAEALHYIVLEVGRLLGPQSAEILLQVAHREGPARGSLAAGIGLGTLFLGATAVFMQLQAGLNVIWDVEPRPGVSLLKFVRRRLISLAMVVSLGFLLLVSLLGNALLSAGVERLSRFSGVQILAGAAAHLVLTFGGTTLLMALIFRLLPDARTAWRDIWRGALFTAALFQVGEWLIAQYLGRAAIGSAYGAAGSLVVLLAWVYYSALIVFAGAEFTHASAVRLGAGTTPRRHAKRRNPRALPAKREPIDEPAP